MRESPLAEWVAGAVAGCPGAVDATASDDTPTPTPAPRDRTLSMVEPPPKHRRRRGRWVTVAAVILVVFGGLGILYAPFLAGGAVWTFLGVSVSTLTILAVLNVVAGIGLYRLLWWARLVAGLVSAFALLFLHAPALLATVANGTWSGIDWLGLVGSMIVMFAVVRRWPAEPAGVD